MGKLKLTYRKSIIGCQKKHKLAIHSLGLRKLNHSRVYEDTPQLRGVIQKVGYLLTVEEVK